MDSNHALTTLINAINLSTNPIRLSWDDIQQWQQGVLANLVRSGLLTKDVNAQTLECIGCENRCFMTVYPSEDARRAFIVCEDSTMQGQMGRLNVPLERLQQWQASNQQFSTVLAHLLDLKTPPEYEKISSYYKLGMLQGDYGRRWALLKINPLALEINGHITPLGDLLYFKNNELVIDKSYIEPLLNTAPKTTVKLHTPKTTKQEARKLATQVMHQDWRDEYVKRKNDPKNIHRTGFDTWCSRQIAKMPIAQGRRSETIRKNMK